jgi:hypothetical protein
LSWVFSRCLCLNILQRMEDKIASLHQVIADMRAQNQRLTQALADTQAELVCGRLRFCSPLRFFGALNGSVASQSETKASAAAQPAPQTATSRTEATSFRTPTQENAASPVPVKTLPSLPTSSKVVRRILSSRVARLTAESRYDAAPGSMRSPSVL